MRRAVGGEVMGMESGGSYENFNFCRGTTQSDLHLKDHSAAGTARGKTRMEET